MKSFSGIPPLVATQILVVFALTSCDAAVPIADTEETTVLASEAIVLTTDPIRLSSEENAKVVGGETAVCVVLGKDIVDGDTEDRQAVYASILGEAEIFGMYHLADGTAVKLIKGAYSWSREGELFAVGELASCLRPFPNDKLPVGTEIEEVELGATGKISALGVFIYSTNKWDF
jgi:hypothetical protein